MTEKVSCFIIIDDDPTNNLICTKFIRMMFPNADIKTFTDPEEGLAYIQTDYSCPGCKSTVLFLDINMPFMNGWQVIEEFMLLPDDVKNKFKIYMLSSSVDVEDQEMAKNHPFIQDFIEKPLSVTRMKAIFPDGGI